MQCGVYMPLLAMGAALGRLVGEVAHAYIPSISRGGYVAGVVTPLWYV